MLIMVCILFLQVPKSSIVGGSFILEETVLKLLTPALRNAVIVFKSSAVIGAMMPLLLRIDYSRPLFMKRNPKEAGTRYTPQQLKVMFYFLKQEQRE